MPLLVTPRQLVHRAELYHQLAQLADAGLPLFQSIETLLRAPPARSFRKPLARVLANLTEGATFSDALQALGHWAPSFDIALLRAGEKSGRLPECLKLLAEYYQERARLIRQVISDLMYPLFLFHFAILIAPIPALVSSGDLMDYAKQTLGVFIPIYAVVFFLL
jgi:type II secretory pathway component PulF